MHDGMLRTCTREACVHRLVQKVLAEYVHVVGSQRDDDYES